MSFILNSVDTNPDPADIRQTSGSVDWLWTALAIFLVTDLIIIFNSFRGLRNYILHQIAIIIVTTAAFAYFCMASNIGHASITVEFFGQGPPGSTRSIYYVRYIMWFINAPLLLLMTYIGTGFPIHGAWSALFMCDVAVVCGLIGALISTTYKWGAFTIGVFALFYVLGHMFTAKISWPSPTGRSRGSYLGSAFVLSCFALLYPLVWGLAEGGNEISVVAEMIWYGIMDVIIFSFWTGYFLWAHNTVELDGHRPVAPRLTKAAEAGVA